MKSCSPACSSVNKNYQTSITATIYSHHHTNRVLYIISHLSDNQPVESLTTKTILKHSLLGEAGPTQSNAKVNQLKQKK